jgi:hypothetical protein
MFVLGEKIMDEECLIEKCFHFKDGKCHYLGNGNNGGCIGLSCDNWVCWDGKVRDIVNSLLPTDRQINFNEHVDILQLNMAIENYNKME